MRFYLVETDKNFFFVQRAHSITEARESFESFDKTHFGNLSKIDLLTNFQAGQLLTNPNIGLYTGKNRWHIHDRDVLGVQL